MLVNDLKIAPSEVWKLDLVEIAYLLQSDAEAKSNTPWMMINAQRKMNGLSGTKWEMSNGD